MVTLCTARGQAGVFSDCLGIDFIQGKNGGHMDGLALCPDSALRPSCDLSGSGGGDAGQPNPKGTQHRSFRRVGRLWLAGPQSWTCTLVFLRSEPAPALHPVHTPSSSWADACWVSTQLPAPRLPCTLPG